MIKVQVIKVQVFKTLEGAQKRARFENAHCGGRYYFTPIRYLGDKPDNELLQKDRWSSYTWRLSRTLKVKA